MAKEVRTINISTSTIFRTLIILLGVVFLYAIRDILVIIFVASIIAAAVNEPVGWLQKRKIPRILGVVVVYLVFFSLLSLAIVLVFPLLAEQVKQLAVNFPEIVDKIGLSVQDWWNRFQVEGIIQSFLGDISNSLSQTVSGFFGTVTGFFGGIFSVVFVFIFSFYLATQEKGIKGFVSALIPTEHRHYLSDLANRIQVKIGGWVRGELLLMLIVGVLTYIGLSLLGVKYALVLALIAGLLEIIPYLGPILAAVPATILAFFQAPFLALMVILLFTVINQVENYVIVPQVMKRAVGLNPVVIIIVMLIGAKLAGVLGVILAVPMAAAITEVVKDFRK
ncbi:MAG: AI-2E family transporter [Patescibacteria group bacterium]|nr:AI-2E family transporter [Patescibacteria group bacterium]